MKKNMIYYLLGVLTTLTIGVCASILYNAKDIEFNPSDENWKVTNVKDALEDIRDNYIPKSKFNSKNWSFNYSGSEESFQIALTGTYKLEVWGASGGNAGSYIGGKGGYSSTTITLNEGDKLYVVVGGAGNNANSGCQYTTVGNGYNGGGGVSCQSGIYFGSGGGGATHIAKSSGLLKDFTNKKNDLIIVAGGGGGASSYDKDNGNGVCGIGGYGGGLNGGTGTNDSNSRTPGGGASQTSVGSTSTDGGFSAQTQASFGLGCSPYTTYSSYMQVAGGAGYYGGGCGTHSGGGGGSSYAISNGIILSGNTNIPSYDGKSTMIGNSGNGYARITYLHS